MSFPEFPDVTHEFSQVKKDKDNEEDVSINLSNLRPEPKSPLPILRTPPPVIKHKWEEATTFETSDPYDNNDTFISNGKSIPAVEIIPAKLSCKLKSTYRVTQG